MDARTFIAAAALLATTILLQSSIVAAATVAHIVGGSTGWTIPPNTSFYSDWSSSQTIAAGDSLVFNFPTGIHTVVEVSKSSFDSCSTTKQIGSTINNGPATVTVTSGTHYYICSVAGHCSAGQKLAITVASAAVPPSVSAAPPTVNMAAPAPAAAPKADGPTASNPAPAAAPVSRSPMPAATVAHIVGGSTGWTIPPNTSFYSDWSSSQTIAAGDSLVFNFPTGIHTVVEVSKSSFDSCSTTKQIGSTINNGPATVTVTSGAHYYICSVAGHCSAGQKLAITVASAAVPPSVSAAPPTVNMAVPAPAAAPKAGGPTASNPAPAAAPVSRSPVPTAVPKVAGPTASSPAPIAEKKSAAPPTGSVPTVPSSTANPPAASGPSSSGNESNSSSALRGAAGIVVALVTVIAASFLV